MCHLYEDSVFLETHNFRDSGPLGSKVLGLRLAKHFLGTPSQAFSGSSPRCCVRRHP